MNHEKYSEDSLEIKKNKDYITYPQVNKIYILIDILLMVFILLKI